MHTITLRRTRPALFALVSLTWIACAAHGEEKAPPGDDIRELKLKDWSPRSMLVTPVTNVETPKYPVIDVHNHLGGGKQFLNADRVAKYLEEMNAAGVETVVNLDGGWGDRLKETVALLDDQYPGRFVTFALLNFEGIDDPDWGEREAKRLEESFRAGAKGLKFHKSLGLTYRYKNGELMPVDDPKLDPVFRMCAKHKRPVVIHSADPAAFFTPLDKNNERWHELNEHPNWLFHGEQYPERDEILAQRNRAIARHPETTFICAHMGNNPENLGALSEWLDRYPNMYVDIDARISELGRQPYAARRFLIKYQDRVMFGTDTPCDRTAYRIYFRFLETDDEYFNCDASHHRQGFWPIYGVFLPDEVLEKIYRKNAERVLFGLGDEGTDEDGVAADDVPQDAHAARRPSLRVARSEDFEVTGRGDARPWRDVEWVNLTARDSSEPFARFKLLYSPTALYVLMDTTDDQIVATKTRDFDHLWTEDCFEAFFWPDERDPLYFEYEISPRGFELPLLIPHPTPGKFLGWVPWDYEGERRIEKRVDVRDGDEQGWSAEFKIPYSLLAPLRGVPPKPGDTWRANFYHVDRDAEGTTGAMWSPVGPSFHEYENFGTLLFE